MACCEGSFCEELVTIDWLKRLTDSAQTNSCTIDLMNGIPGTGCCAQTGDASAYTPSYRELGTIQQLVISGNTPSMDVNGLVLSAGTAYNGCCGTDNGSGDTLSRGEVEYGYTYASALTISVDADTDVDVCSSAATYDKTITWVRKKRYCNDTTDTIATTSGDVVNELFSGLTYPHAVTSKTYSGITSGEVRINFEYYVSGSTVDPCGHTVSGSTSGTGDYDIIVSIDCPTDEIPCDGGDVPFTISGDVCNELTYLFEVPEGAEIFMNGSTTAEASSAITPSTSGNDVGIVRLAKNDNGDATQDITIRPATGSSLSNAISNASITCTVNRQGCAEVVNDADCSLYYSYIFFTNAEYAVQNNTPIT